MNKHLSILGTRGIPAQYGGFETFAEKLSLYLVAKGWEVTVYCQDYGVDSLRETIWNGVHRLTVPVKSEGVAGTIIFDFKSIRRSLRDKGLFLTLGYNTAIFNILNRLRGQINIINMDGIEWQRDKWGGMAKSWFFINELVGCRVGNYLIADHPDIKAHLATRVNPDKIFMIPYGADDIHDADERVLDVLGVQANRFSVIIARPEPENSIYEMVRAFTRKFRAHKLLVLGNFQPKSNAYHRDVIAAGNEEVIFPGAIYDRRVVRALRYYCRLYLHGHRVGGTNPSLVEALGAGSAVIAHGNRFNQWVAGRAAAYFNNEDECDGLLDRLLGDDVRVLQMKKFSKARFKERFTWDRILSEYEELFLNIYPD